MEYNNMSTITFCIPTKDNLRYLRGSIESIRKNAVTNPKILVYVDSSNDGTIEWLTEHSINFIVNETNTPRGIAYGYNRCIEQAETDIVCMFHADMYMAKGFDTAILKYISDGVVVSGTRIEPPLHPEGEEKIVHGFGMYPEDFNEAAFLEFAYNKVIEHSGRTTRGIFAPWAIHKKDILAVGLHDENLHSYHEDSDIFNRFVLAGFTILQTWEGYVYHLTCRGGQFQNGIEQVTTNPQFHSMKQKSFREFIRKWGQFIRNDEYHHPIIQPRYRKKLVLPSANLQLVSQLEPWFDLVSVADAELVRSYIAHEHSMTSRNLENTFYGSDEGIGVTITVNPLTFTQNDYILIHNIGTLLSDIPPTEIGEYSVGNLHVAVNKPTPMVTGYISQ